MKIFGGEGRKLRKKWLLSEVMQRNFSTNITPHPQTREEMPPANPCRRWFKQSSRTSHCQGLFMLLQSVAECRRGVKTPLVLWITEKHLATSLVFNEKERRGVGMGQPL